MRRALMTGVVVLLSAAVAGAADPTPARLALEDRVGAALVEAVAARMGASAQVIVEDVELLNVRESDTVEATPDPEARIGGRVGFALLGLEASGQATRVVPIGRAVATVRVDVRHVRALRLIPRGTTLGREAVEEVTSTAEGALLKRLPTLDELADGRALRSLAPGEIVTGAAVTFTPAVRSGQVVRAIARVAGAEIAAMVVAAQNGEPGSVIRVVNRDSRRELRARVVGDGLVEVIR